MDHRPREGSVVTRLAEVTGLGSARCFAAAMSAAFTDQAGSTAQFIEELRTRGVDGPVIAAAVAAQRASEDAAAAWARAEQVLTAHGQVADAYGANPGAGSKEFIVDDRTTTEVPTPDSAMPASAPADPRVEIMRFHGVYWCPDWCLQDSEEHQYEQHWSAWRGFTTGDGERVQVRLWMSWWTDSDDNQIEVQVLPDGPNPERPGANFGLNDVSRLRDLLDEAERDLEDHEGVEAYEGAEDDENVGEDEPADATVDQTR